jgi:Hint domain
MEWAVRCYVVQAGDIGEQLRVAIGFTDSVTGQTANTFSAPTFDVAPCYCAGTVIRTPHGEQRVETLKIGDKVATISGAARPIKWIGRRGYSGRFVMGRKDILPVCIKKDALGNDMPRRDLWISPNHAMYFQDSDVLVEAKDLINGVSIIQAERVDRVDYFHIELDSHDVLIAEGAPAESFIDDASRGLFHNAAEYWTRHSEGASVTPRYFAARCFDGAELEAVRRCIALRAGLIRAEGRARLGKLRGFVDQITPRQIRGWAQNLEYPEAPVCLDIYAGTQFIGQALANRYREDLKKAGCGSGCHSFSFVPPAGLTFALDAIEVRRSVDGSVLPFSFHLRLRVPRSAVVAKLSA